MLVPNKVNGYYASKMWIQLVFNRVLLIIFFAHLNIFGLTWDDEVVYQSQRTALYQQALQLLEQQQAIFWCNCTRSQLAQTGQTLYTGNLSSSITLSACLCRTCD